MIVMNVIVDKGAKNKENKKEPDVGEGRTANQHEMVDIKIHLGEEMVIM